MVAKEITSEIATSEDTPIPSDASKSTLQFDVKPDGQIDSEIDEEYSPPSKLPLWRRALGVFWDAYSAEPRERKYTHKVDLNLFAYIMFGYFIKYLDQTNYSNAYVSGMQKDLSLYGNERNYLVTTFNIGIIVGTIPAMMLQMKYVRPSILIPSCELAWGILVIGMSGVKNVKTMYALRFLVGLLESTSFPGYAALLGSWFGPAQLAKRVALVENTEGIAGMFSGYLQAGLYSGMNGKGGLAGWRWLFIFDGIISIPIALWGFYAIPDLPFNTRARWLNKSDREYGIERMKSFGRAAPTGLTWKAVKRVYGGWYIWVFVVPYVSVALMSYGSGYFSLWLEAEGYSVSQTNTIPTAGNVVSIVVAIASGVFADRTGMRKATVIVIILLVLLSNILLSIWNIPKGAIFFANFLSFVGNAGQPLIISWGQELAQHDAELRQLLVATGNVIYYALSASIPVVLFPTNDAPHYKFGYQVQILFCGTAFIGVFALDFLVKREFSKKPTRVTDSGQVVLVLEEDRLNTAHAHEV